MAKKAVADLKQRTEELRDRSEVLGKAQGDLTVTQGKVVRLAQAETAAKKAIEELTADLGTNRLDEEERGREAAKVATSLA